MVGVNTDAAVARLAAFGLPGVDPTPIVLADPDEVLNLATARRVLPWVAGAVDAGWVADVSDEWRADLRARHLGAIQTTLAAHSAAIDVAGRLAAAGIGDARILKGCATAHLDYERQADRFSTDVDVLVRPDDRPAFIAQFPDDAIPVPRSEHWQDHYGKATTVTTGRKVQVDVHTMLGQGYFGLSIPIDELFADPTPFTIGGADLLALDGPNRLIHAANHAPQVTRDALDPRRPAARAGHRRRLGSRCRAGGALGRRRAVRPRCAVGVVDVPRAIASARRLGQHEGGPRSPAPGAATRRRTTARPPADGAAGAARAGVAGLRGPDGVPVTGVPGRQRQELGDAGPLDVRRTPARSADGLRSATARRSAGPGSRGRRAGGDNRRATPPPGSGRRQSLRPLRR